jgi:hypothetical protein
LHSRAGATHDYEHLRDSVTPTGQRPLTPVPAGYVRRKVGAYDLDVPARLLTRFRYSVDLPRDNIYIAVRLEDPDGTADPLQDEDVQGAPSEVMLPGRFPTTIGGLATSVYRFRTPGPDLDMLTWLAAHVVLSDGSLVRIVGHAPVKFVDVLDRAWQQLAGSMRLP